MIAVACSDLHLRHKPPAFRAAEPDWFLAMERPLGEIKRLSQVHGNCPILYAGDLFHRFDPPPELITFALKHLPLGYAVPGQHDLRNHSYQDIKKSAYWTLVEAGALVDLKPGNPYPLEDMLLHGWPWGVEPAPLSHPLLAGIHVAVVHKYVWAPGHGYDGAPEASRLRSVKKCFRGYDAVVVGDNHKGFFSAVNERCTLFNCGGLRRDRSDQVDYRPRVGLVRADGTVTPHYLDVSEDKTVTIAKARKAEAPPELADFVEELSKLGDRPFDFVEALREYCDSNKVRREVVLALAKATRR